MGIVKYFLKELFRTFRDRDVIVLLLAGPIFLTILFAGVYINSYVEDIPIAVLDEDNSSMSRMIVSQFQENDRFNMKYIVSSKEELRDKIESRKAYMGLYIPYGFSKDVTTRKSTEALIIVDGTNIVIGNSSYAAAATIIQTIAAGVNIKMIEAKGLTSNVAENMAMVFKFNDRTLYDPRMTYLNYMILGFVAVFLQQVMLSGLGISLIKQGEDIACEKTIFKVLINILSCATFALISTFLAVGSVNLIFKVPIRGSLISALLMCVIFIFAISCPAIIIGAIVKDKIKFAQIAYMLSMPAFVSCGYVWPQDQIPKAVMTIIKVFWPLAGFARAFDEILFKGVPITEFSSNIIEMVVYTLFWMPVALIIFKWRYRPKSIKSDIAVSEPSIK